MHAQHLKATAVAGALVVGLLGIASAPAQAKGVEVRRSGSCSAATDWKLKAKADDGRIELEYEVDSNRVGQTWRVLVTDNGATVVSGTRTTLAPSGSFSVERRVPNRAGADAFVATARNAATGETCRGTLTFTG